LHAAGVHHTSFYSRRACRLRNDESNDAYSLFLHRMVFWRFGRDSETGLKRRSQRKAKQCIRLWPPTSCHDLGIVLLISGFDPKLTKRLL